jgi:hypothetical protein
MKYSIAVLFAYFFSFQVLASITWSLNPGGQGQVRFKFCRPEIVNCDPDRPSTYHEVIIFFFPEDDPITEEKKASKLKEKLDEYDAALPPGSPDSKKFNAKRTGGDVTVNTSMVKKTFDSTKSTEDKEKADSKKPPPPPPPKNETSSLIIGFDTFAANGLLAGIDQNGLESVFASTIWFDGTTISSSFNYTDLTSSTIDGLLTDIFNDFMFDLPSTLRTNLFLDLDANEIKYETQSFGSEIFVKNYTSDINSYATLGLINTLIPEPPMLVIFISGLIGLGSRRFKK